MTGRQLLSLLRRAGADMAPAERQRPGRTSHYEGHVETSRWDEVRRALQAHGFVRVGAGRKLMAYELPGSDCHVTASPVAGDRYLVLAAGPKRAAA